MRDNKQPLFAAGLVAALICITVAACGNQRTIPMDKTGWKTHCFGRFLVDLPPDAKVKPTYQLWGDEISRLPDSPDSLAARIEKLEQRLKAERHESGTSMFIRRSAHGGGSITLLSWGRPYNKIMMREDTYLVTPKWAYQYGGDVSPSRESIAIQNAADLATNIRTLAVNEIPVGPGYCIDRGIIANKEFQVESFDISVELPEHPRMAISLIATTQGELDEDTLLERAAGSEFALLAQGAKLLRKGKRDAGPIKGGEYLMANTEHSQRIYTFAWEAPGKVDSIAEPYFAVELQALGQSVVDEDHPYRPPFKSDEEALQLWDAIIESIRLRPGAA